MAICRPWCWGCASVGETSSIIKTLLGEIFITHGFSSLCGETRGVERNPDSALSYSQPLHCVSDPTLDRPSEPTNPVSPTNFPRNELFSGKHFARDFRIMLHGKLSGRQILGEKLHQRPRVQEDKRRYLCEQITQDACSWEHILKPGRFEFLHEFHFIYFLSTIARLDWVFIWRDLPAPTYSDL